MRVAIFVFLLFHLCDGKIFKKCELATELKFKHNFSIDDVKTWVCIAEYESTFNSEAVNEANWDGSKDYGLFQLNNRYWCGDEYGRNVCRLPCQALLDDDLTDDIKCARRIVRDTKRWMKTDNGLVAWVAYVKRCQHRDLDAYIEECMDELSEPPVEETTETEVQTEAPHQETDPEPPTPPRVSVSGLGQAKLPAKDAATEDVIDLINDEEKVPKIPHEESSSSSDSGTRNVRPPTKKVDSIPSGGERTNDKTTAITTTASESVDEPDSPPPTRVSGLGHLGVSVDETKKPITDNLAPPRASGLGTQDPLVPSLDTSIIDTQPVEIPPRVSGLGIPSTLLDETAFIRVEDVGSPSDGEPADILSFGPPESNFYSTNEEVDPDDEPFKISDVPVTYLEPPYFEFEHNLDVSPSLDYDVESVSDGDFATYQIPSSLLQPPNQEFQNINVDASPIEVNLDIEPQDDFDLDTFEIPTTHLEPPGHEFGINFETPTDFKLGKLVEKEPLTKPSKDKLYPQPENYKLPSLGDITSQLQFQEIGVGDFQAIPIYHDFSQQPFTEPQFQFFNTYPSYLNYEHFTPLPLVTYPNLYHQMMAKNFYDPVVELMYGSIYERNPQEMSPKGGFSFMPNTNSKSIFKKLPFSLDFSKNKGQTADGYYQDSLDVNIKKIVPKLKFEKKPININIEHLVKPIRIKVPDINFNKIVTPIKYPEIGFTTVKKPVLVPEIVKKPLEVPKLESKPANVGFVKSPFNPFSRFTDTAEQISLRELYDG